MQKNGLIRKSRLSSKYMPQSGKQILPNISKSKGSQTMKFGPLIKHNLRNIVLGKP